MTTADKIAQKRKENNLTQDGLASLLDVSRQAVSRWESGLAYPETEKLIKMSRIFNCTVDWLLKDDSEEITAERISSASFKIDCEKEFCEEKIDREKIDFAFSVITKITTCFAMAGVLLVFIFSFFMGVTTSGNGSLASYDLSVTDMGNTNLYYYFSNVYTDIKLAVAAADGASKYYGISLYIHAVFGTVTSIGSITANTALFFVCLYKFMGCVAFKKNNNFGKWAITAYFVYLISVSLFKNLNGGTVTYAANGSIISVSAGYNDATVAGIACGGVCVGFYMISQIVIKIVVNWRSLLKTRILFFFCSVVIAVVCAAVAMGFVSCQPVGITLTDNDGFLAIHIPFMKLSAEFADYWIYQNIPFPSICAQLSSFAVIILLGLTMASLFNALAGYSKGKAYIYYMIAALLAVIIFTFFAPSAVSMAVDVDYAREEVSMGRLLALGLLAFAAFCFSVIAGATCDVPIEKDNCLI